MHICMDEILAAITIVTNMQYNLPILIKQFLTLCKEYYALSSNR